MHNMWTPSDFSSSTNNNQFSFFGTSLSGGSVSSSNNSDQMKMQMNGLGGGDISLLGHGMSLSSSSSTSSLPSIASLQMPLALDQAIRMPLSLSIPGFINSNLAAAPVSSIYGSGSSVNSGGSGIGIGDGLVSLSLGVGGGFGMPGLADQKSPFSPTTIPSNMNMKSFFSPESHLPVSPQNIGGGIDGGRQQTQTAGMMPSSLLSDLRQEAVEFVPKGTTGTNGAISSSTSSGNLSAYSEPVSDLRVTAPEFKPKPKAAYGISASTSPVYVSSSSAGSSDSGTLQPNVPAFKPRGMISSSSSPPVQPESPLGYPEFRPTAAEFRPKMGGPIIDNTGNGLYGEEGDNVMYSELSSEATEFVPGRGLIDTRDLYSQMPPRSGLPLSGPPVIVVGVVKLTCLVYEFDIHYSEDEVKDAVNTVLIANKVPRDGLAISSQMLVVTRGEKGYVKVNFATTTAGDLAVPYLNNSELFPGIFFGAKLSVKNISGETDLMSEPPISPAELRPDAPEFVPSFGLVQTNMDYSAGVSPTGGGAAFNSGILRVIPPSSISSYGPSSEQLRASAVEFKPRSPPNLSFGAIAAASTPTLAEGFMQQGDNSNSSREGSVGTEQLRASAAEFKPRTSPSPLAASTEFADIHSSNSTSYEPPPKRQISPGSGQEQLRVAAQEFKPRSAAVVDTSTY